MTWREMLRTKWTWVAAAVGGGAGLIVFLRRRGQGGAGGIAGEEAGYSPGGVGYFDSTGTDVAEQLGQLSAAWARQFDDFTRSVDERISQLSGEEQAKPGPSTPGVPTLPTTIPYQNTTPKQPKLTPQQSTQVRQGAVGAAVGVVGAVQDAFAGLWGSSSGNAKTPAKTYAI